MQFETPSITSTLAYGSLVLYAVYFLLKQLDVPILSPQELLWNAIVYIIPTPLLLDRARRQELEANDMLPSAPAQKSASRCHFFATDSINKFRNLGSRFLGQPIEHVELIDLGG